MSLYIFKKVQLHIIRVLDGVESVEVEVKLNPRNAVRKILNHALEQSMIVYSHDKFKIPYYLYKIQGKVFILEIFGKNPFQAIIYPPDKSELILEEYDLNHKALKRVVYSFVRKYM